MLLHQSTENAHSYFCKGGKKLQNNKTITLTLFRVERALNSYFWRHTQN